MARQRGEAHSAYLIEELGVELQVLRGLAKTVRLRGRARIAQQRATRDVELQVLPCPG